VIREAGILPQSEDANNVRALAAKSLEPITQKLRDSLERHPISPREAIQDAYKETLITLYQLGRIVDPYYQKRPQFFSKSDGSYSVVTAAPALENLVLSGGGTKGEAYVGFLNAMEASGTLQNLKSIAGSSAGGITATFIAAGMSAKEITDAAKSIDLWKALVEESKDPAIKKRLDEYLDHDSISIHQIGFAGYYLTEKMNQSIAGSIKSYLDSLSKEELEQKVNAINGISDPDRQLINQLKEDLDSNKTHMITFGELALLQKMDPRFKELTVTAFDLDEQKEIYFNTETCPTMSIAIAATISAALPLAYRAKRDPNTGDTLVDGGIGSNVPTEYFAKEPQEKTLVLGFDDNGDFYNVVNGPPTITNKTIFSKTEESLEVFLRGNPQYQKDLEQDKQKLKNAGPNAFCIKHGELETISFTATPEQVAEAQRLAEIHTWEQLLLRQHQAVQHDYNSLDEAMEGMAITDLNLLIRD
jgi:predicted acylesterase/phospholipase RssA